eukprot:GHRR01018732.1.p2 GENE.GHRR01018732.1~~GHRR01018732.1.p2  ORF type:complete len:107 (+),score=36.15 GHRR01018732.1:335-655(+)
MQATNAAAAAATPPAAVTTPCNALAAVPPMQLLAMQVCQTYRLHYASPAATWFGTPLYSPSTGSCCPSTPRRATATVVASPSTAVLFPLNQWPLCTAATPAPNILK